LARIFGRQASRRLELQNQSARSSEDALNDADNVRLIDSIDLRPREDVSLPTLSAI
jgi:hypothetical protein